MTEVGMKVHGLREVVGALRKVDANLPKELKARFGEIAETVAKVVRRKATSDFAHPTGKAVGSVKGRSGTSKAGIAAGGRAAEYYPWLDFGGRVGRGRSIARDLVPGGRYLYPAIAEQSGETAKAAEDAVEEMARKAGFTTRDGVF